MMTIDEKRNAIDLECNKYEACEICPHNGNKFCKKHSHYNADSEIIDKWYNAFFKEDSVPHIKDSGTRREFETGAVRDIQEGKGRCDLLPLDVVADILDDAIIELISKFEKTSDTNHLIDILHRLETIHPKWNDTETILLEVAKHFEAGAKKYGECN